MSAGPPGRYQRPSALPTKREIKPVQQRFRRATKPPSRLSAVRNRARYRCDGAASAAFLITEIQFYINRAKGICSNQKEG